jgi:hypothetical protein
MKRGVPTCEWDLPPDFYRWLSLCLAQLVIKDKYIYNKVISRMVLSCNLLPSPKNPIRKAHYITCIEEKRKDST